MGFFGNLASKVGKTALHIGGISKKALHVSGDIARKALHVGNVVASGLQEQQTWRQEGSWATLLVRSRVGPSR